MSTIFSSPVSIKLSSGTSLIDREVFPNDDDDDPLIPMSILFTIVTFGVLTLSIGQGRW